MKPTEFVIVGNGTSDLASVAACREPDRQTSKGISEKWKEMGSGLQPLQDQRPAFVLIDLIGGEKPLYPCDRFLMNT